MNTERALRILAELRKETAEGGSRAAKALKKLARRLHPHFVEDEDFALLSRGLLPLLSHGRVMPDMKDILLMTDMLKADLDQILKEHEELLATLEKPTAR